MRNILTILRADLCHLVTNVIGAIVIMGLILVPPMYAWFTTAGFWNPYSDTGDLKVAVACDDKGFSADGLPMTINVGQQVLDQIRANRQFDWIITDTTDAVGGVKSGAYYAAIVIPADFSADLMTVFGKDARHATIDYYSNEKENAIAPRVTSTGATTLQDEIDQAFTKAVTGVALKATEDLATLMSGEDVSYYGDTLLKRLNSVLEAVSASSTQVKAFAGLMGSTASLVRATASVLDEGADEADEVAAATDEGSGTLDAALKALEDADGLSAQAVDQGKASFAHLAKAVTAAFDALAVDPAKGREALTTVAADAKTLEAAYTKVRDDLAKVLPDGAALTALDGVIASLKDLETLATQAATEADNLDQAVQGAQASMAGAVTKAQKSLDEAESSYAEGLKASVSSVAATLKEAEDSTGALATQAGDSAGAVAVASRSLAEDLDAAKQALNDAAVVLDDAEKSLTTSRDDLAEALEQGDLDKVRTLIGDSPTKLSEFLSAPTRLIQHTVYPMPNNGSAMSPFYTSLSLWIGALFAVVLVNVEVSPTLRARLKNPRPAQLYLGRYGVFGLISVAQALTVCLGNVFFLGVQCEHLGLYLLAGCWVGVVFSSMIYTLTLSFGSIGKAAAIIGLVMQLGGSGGIFPIQLSGPIFQAIYPWLPFDYTMTMFEGCIAGIYGNQYWIAFGKLGLFLAGAMVVGLVLRRPVIRLNDWVLGKLHETRLF